MHRTAEDFACSQSKGCRKFRQNWYELFDLFSSNLSFADIGQMLGVKKQAAHQLYGRWFKDHLGRADLRVQGMRAQQATLAMEASLKQQLEDARQDPDFQYFAVRARDEHGTELEPVVAYEGTGLRRGLYPVYRTQEGKYIRAYVKRTAFKPSQHGPQVYASFQTTRGMLEGVDVYFLLIDIPGFEKELLIVRSALFAELMTDKSSYTHYVRLGDWKKRPRKTRVDLRDFKDAWWVLDL